MSPKIPNLTSDNKMEDNINDEIHNSILGICIPTYNRANFLRENLNELLSFVKTYKLPVYISDNASTDDTSEVVYTFRNFHEFTYYRRNDTNLGFSSNLNSVVLMAQSQYVWILGDDDLIIGSTAYKVIEAIDEDFDLIFLNRKIFSDSKQAVNVDRDLNIVRDNKYNSIDHDKFLLDVGELIGCMSSYVFKRKLWFGTESIKEESFLEFLHAKIILSNLADSKIKLIANPIILTREGNSSFSSSRLVKNWFYDFPNTIYSLQNNFSIKSIRRALRSHGHLTYVVKGLQLANEVNLQMGQIKNYILMNSTLNVFERIVVSLEFLFPKALIEVLMRTLKHIRLTR